MPPATVALLQTDPGPDATANVDRALAMIAEAARAGADWVCLPEIFHCRGRQDAKLSAAERVPGPLTTALSDAARTNGAWLFAGSFDERSDDPANTWNASLVLTRTAASPPPTASCTCSTSPSARARGRASPRASCPATASRRSTPRWVRSA